MDGTEREMTVRMQQGDEEAFAWLFHRYQNRVLRMAYLISGNYADSEDIVQETFVEAYRKIAYLCQMLYIPEASEGSGKV